MTALVISNLANLISLSLNAAYFGASIEMDAFLAANRVAETIFLLTAGGAMGSAFIPTFTGLLVHGEKQLAWRLASALANLVLVILILLTGLAAIFAPQVVRYLLASGFAGNPAAEALTVDLLRLMLPSAILFGLSGLIMGILNSHQKFFVPALTPAFYRLGMIFGVIVLAPRMGIYGLAWGVVLGSALHLALQLPTLLRLGGQYFPTLGLKLSEVRQVIQLMGPRFFGVAVVQLNFWVNINLASRMAEGSLAAISWGLTIMLMPQAVIAQAVATAAMPTLAAQYALGKADDVRASLAASLRGILLLALPASVGLVLLRQPIVALLMQYGNFDTQSTQLVSWALLWYATGLVGHCIVEILARAFYAMQNTRIPVLVGSAAMAINILFSLAFSSGFSALGWMPHGGLALANSLATAIEATGLFWLLRRRLKGVRGAWLWSGAARSLLATVFMIATVALWNSASISWRPLVSVAGGVGLGAASYMAGVYILGIEEIRSLAQWARRKLKI